MDNSHIVRICSAQITSVWDDPDKTLQKAGLFVHHAAVSGAALICFPEQFATGWDPCSDSHAEERDGTIVSTLRNLATENNIGILGSFREKAGSHPKNTAVAVGSDGSIHATYAKMHLFSPGGEDTIFAPGSDLGIFTLGPLTCGIALCYDLRFPELFRLYAKKGVQAVFVPAAWPESRMKHWELFITARACENQMYVCGINTTGRTPVDTYVGGSMTVDPQGSIVCRANDAEQLLFCDLDPEIVTTARETFPVARDRREELYHTLAGRRI
ncbi:nitrilase-related carbon-nitrogen hydrolase [Methanoregula sp.]|uniref:nitrilase-related carbon-nitrogen hydrolase n=1 Tax=Methanoregula sp. TaxID=2052170 RepID=UPI00236F7F10|nr:nitrilase-related carbon-nitrogen hydrolase [Methanoregula sp.]MDD1686598.1 carbon-nitrogen hydrolase family protein [Methanoregula sp.]